MYVQNAPAYLEKGAEPFFHAEKRRVVHAEIGTEVGGHAVGTQKKGKALFPCACQQFLPAPARPGMVNDKIRLDIF